MFFSLYCKECKSITKSIIYFIFVGVIVLFYVTQLGDYAGNDIKQFYDPDLEIMGQSIAFNPLIKPVEGAESYGYKSAEIPEQIMPYVVAALVNEHMGNRFATYPVGFYKTVKLNEKQLSEIKEILTEITGLSYNDLYDASISKMQSDSYTAFSEGRNIDYKDAIPIAVSYEQFKEKMAYIDDMLGGGSGYATEKLKRYGTRAITYEEKLEEYNTVIEEDKISGAYARLFCDYMGITIALFSIFVPVSYLMRDRRASINELVYSRGISSTKLITARYLALVTMMLLPFLLLSLLPTIQLMAFGAKNALTVDGLAFVKYILGWLLPTILAATSVGMLITVLTDTPIAILVQFLYSFLCIFTGVGSGAELSGNYSFEITIRHNTLGSLQLVKDSMNQLLLNRISYTAVSLLIMLLAIFVYELKRRGRIDVGGSLRKILGNIKGTNKANPAR